VELQGVVSAEQRPSPIEAHVLDAGRARERLVEHVDVRIRGRPRAAERLHDADRSLRTAPVPHAPHSAPCASDGAET
jgi:hypothetical protein